MPRQSNLKIKESFFNENSFSSEAFAHVDEKRHVSHEMANRAVLRGPAKIQFIVFQKFCSEKSEMNF